MQFGIDWWIGVVGVCYLWFDMVLLLVMVGIVIIFDIVMFDSLFVGGLILFGFMLMMCVLLCNIVQLFEVDVSYLSVGDVVVLFWVDNMQDVIVLGCVIVQVGVIVQMWMVLQK